jgi:ligand-binding sensor domain-containing protein
MFRRIRTFFYLAAAIVTIVIATPSQHIISSWTVDDGLPQNAVYSILQTRDGYLWFTTLDGLVRFDGMSFTIFSRSNTKGITSNRFNTLCEDATGDLWIGTDDGGLTRFHAGQFTSYTTADGLPSNLIKSLSNGQNGLLAVTHTGPVQWQDQKLASLAEPGLPDDRIDPFGSYYRSKTGVLWFTDHLGLHSYKGGRVVDYSLPDNFGYSDNVLYEDSHGSLWIGTVASGLFKFSDGRFTRFTLKDGLPDQYVTAIIEDRQGNFWVGTRAGLAHLKGNRFIVYTTGEGLSGNDIASIFEDREGNLWVGTYSRGLNRLTRKVVVVYGKRDGLSTDAIYPIFQDSRRDIWIGGREGTLTKYKDGVFTPIMQSIGHPYENATALAEDNQGRIWIGKLGSLLFLRGGKLEQFDPKIPLGGVIVRAIHQDRKGVIWFATSSGLLKYEHEVVVRYTTEAGLAGNDAEVLLEDAEGRLWIGTYGGLTKYQNGSFTSFTEADGLASNHVRSLYQDHNGSLWIGTYDGGLSRLRNGRFSRCTTENGLFNNGVFCILEDDLGNLW